MSVIWQYLDKRRAAVQALKDYGSMSYIIKNTDTEICKVSNRMIGVGSPGMDGMPHAHNPQSAEERLVEGIDEIDVLKERYRQAMEYMSWFRPAWEELAEDERFVLQAFCCNEESETNVVFSITERFGIERSSAYNKKNRALDHLTTLLFGRL